MSSVTLQPAPNGAGGVVAERRVQLHPSRFLLSAVQTVKSRVRLCLGPLQCQCQVHGQCRGPQGPCDSPSHQPFHAGLYCHGQAGGKGSHNPQGSAASSTALADYNRRDNVGGKPPGQRWQETAGTTLAENRRDNVGRKPPGQRWRKTAGTTLE
ncbi:hypothetical protein NDU88_005389 [Pleurodeles waltl]|uniref:Uncharacterized protein n=1 Tax=Pleurodeles waltl TaxID=8319 RepID=A0AAV7N5P1_PLEWA|nr:hypothetical protein NDU88_005389 [Pleurodeles waltl]